MTLISDARRYENFHGTKIVTVGVVCGGEILTGKRRDNGLWTSPGGHIDEGEGVLEAACREVLEESGITVHYSQLEIIKVERVVSHRTKAPFVVFAFLARIEKEAATAKNDPDKEISEWKWVPIDKDTPELKKEARHAKDDFVLQMLGINEVRMSEDTTKKSRTMEEVSKDLKTAGYKESPEPPETEKKVDGDEAPAAPPEPKSKTPEEMKMNPEEFLKDENATGD